MSQVAQQADEGRQLLGAVVGSLLEKLLGQTGLWTPEMACDDGDGSLIYATPDEWLEDARLSSAEVRDWFLAVARDYGLDANTLQMTPAQLRGLGFPESFGAGDSDDE